MSAATRTNVLWLLAGVALAGWAYWLGHGACLVASGLLVAFWAASLIGLTRADRRAARELRGECPVCGYDLRSKPHRCPECGHVPPHGVRIAFEDWLAADCRRP